MSLLWKNSIQLIHNAVAILNLSLYEYCWTMPCICTSLLMFYYNESPLYVNLLISFLTVHLVFGCFFSSFSSFSYYVFVLFKFKLFNILFFCLFGFVGDCAFSAASLPVCLQVCCCSWTKDFGPGCPFFLFWLHLSGVWGLPVMSIMWRCNTYFPAWNAAYPGAKMLVPPTEYWGSG